MKHGALAIVAATLATFAPSAARADRVIDYAIDEATAARPAAEQGVALAPLPARGSEQIALHIAPTVDHEVLRVGIACSAWTVQNPMSALLRRFMAARDADGALSTPSDPQADRLVTIDRARTLSRCVETGEMKTTCITRVSIEGSSARNGEAGQPFHIEREEATKGIGACAGLTRGIGLVSRAATHALMTRLDEASPAAE